MNHMLHDLLNLATMAALLLLIVLWPRLHKNRWWEVGAVALIAAVGLGHLILYTMVAEDAFITYRYARNLAQGHGPVFNIGEQVEGYSCFLWMLLLSLGHALSGLPLELLGRWMGGAAAVGTLVAVHMLGRQATGGDARGGIMAAALLACSGSFAAWGLSGMETPLFCLLTVLAVLAALGGSSRAAGVVAGLAVMTRPEGLFVVAALAIWLALRRAPESAGGRGGWRALVPLAIPLGLLLVPWTAWRLWYYGYLIPNAVAAKAGAELHIQLWWGLKYFYKFSQANPLLLGLIVVAVAGLVQRLRGRISLSAQDLLLVSLPLSGLLFVIAVGGDWMPAWRFFVPWLPLACVSLARAWQLGARGAGVTTRSLAVGVALSLLCLSLWEMSLFNFDMMPAVRQSSERVRSSSTVGAWMGSTLPRGTTVATYANGSLSYHAGSKINFIDMLGLTDEHIARSSQRNSAMGPGHIAGDLDYVARRKPDVIMFSSGTTTPRPECQGNARFIDDHDVAVFMLPGNDLPMGNHVSLQILRSKKAALQRQLGSAPGVKDLTKVCKPPGQPR